jgi:N-acetylglutamate synthase-like GNAT family acetyltransferase
LGKKMTIRDAVLSDSADIAQLTAELGYIADTEAIRGRLSKILGQKDQLVAVAVSEGNIVGWLQVHTSEVLESGFRAEIVGLIVAERCRRHGVGRRLVQRAEQWAVEIGAEMVVVRSNTKRVESHSFYPALGFPMAKTQAVYRKALKKEPG